MTPVPGLRTKGRGALRTPYAARQEKGVRALETLVVLTVATVAFLWVILAHSTPEEHARLHDSIGQSTHIAWR
jgi:hypothetical protein